MRIELLIDQLERHKIAEFEEELLLERLRTHAEGVGSIRYGDDVSHGTATGDRLERGAIKLTEAKEKLTGRRIERADLRSESADFFFERLEALPAYIMFLYCIDGMTCREIAEKIGRSHGFVNKVVTESKSFLKTF